jgi:cobyric acid synthase
LPCFESISHAETFPFPQHVFSSKEYAQGTREFQGLDGAMSVDGLVWGTYIHGIFDQPGFRGEWLNRVRIRKNLQTLDVKTSQAVSERLVHALDRWAEHVGTYLNMKFIFSAIEFREDKDSSLIS